MARKKAQEPPYPLCDEHLARSARDGSLDAFDALVHRFQHRLYGLLLQRVRCPADAEDLTQETFLRAYQRIDQYRDGYTFGAWLFTIAIRLAATHHRRGRPVRSHSDFPNVPDPAAGPVEQLAAREQTDAIWTLARKLLDEQQITSLWLFYVEEMPIPQIAQVLNRSRVAIRVGLFRSRRRLAKALQPAGDAPRPAVHLRPAPFPHCHLTTVKG